jgi:serine/threonine protein kinase
VQERQLPKAPTGGGCPGHERLTATGSFVGTLAYAAPEQVLGREVSAATDVWAAGVMLYQLLAHRLPFQADSEQEICARIVGAAPPALAELCPGQPPELYAAVQAMLAREPADRPTAASALHTLRRLRTA